MTDGLLKAIEICKDAKVPSPGSEKYKGYNLAVDDVIKDLQHELNKCNPMHMLKSKIEEEIKFHKEIVVYNEYREIQRKSRIDAYEHVLLLIDRIITNSDTNNLHTGEV